MHNKEYKKVLSPQRKNMFDKGETQTNKFPGNKISRKQKDDVRISIKSSHPPKQNWSSSSFIQIIIFGMDDEDLLYNFAISPRKNLTLKKKSSNIYILTPVSHGNIFSFHS